MVSDKASREITLKIMRSRTQSSTCIDNIHRFVMGDDVVRRRPITKLTERHESHEITLNSYLLEHPSFTTKTARLEINPNIEYQNHIVDN